MAWCTRELYDVVNRVAFLPRDRDGLTRDARSLASDHDGAVAGIY